MELLFINIKEKKAYMEKPDRDPMQCGIVLKNLHWKLYWQFWIELKINKKSEKVKSVVRDYQRWFSDWKGNSYG